MKTNRNKPILLWIADGGSTKTDWCGIDTDGERHYLRTRGFNPLQLDDNEIRAILSREWLPACIPSDTPDQPVYPDIHYYGAGCLPALCRRIERIFTGLIPGATAEVRSDLWGAARALCGHEAGIACILGTGANSCLYDGRTIADHIPPLGYILGDEGSGAYLGKRLIAGLLKRTWAQELREQFEAEYGWTEDDLIRKVYREPEANRFLASFAPFLKTRRQHPDIHRMLVDSFCAFFKMNIEPYAHRGLPVHFVGSIAFHFREELEEAAHLCGRHIGKILEKPIESMADYHVSPLEKTTKEVR
ncbi:MAG: hypothetical protein LUC45_08935 [Paraprevotella sp.]|nr:hypothetical protein [Paraprevotella sp.]